MSLRRVPLLLQVCHHTTFSVTAVCQTSSASIQIQIQNRFIVRCIKYTIQKHINTQGKTFWNNILRIWYTDLSYGRHWMWRTFLRFRKRYTRFNELHRDLHTRNQHCHVSECRPFNGHRTKTYWDTPKHIISINMHIDKGSKKLWVAYGLLICLHDYLHNL